MMAQASAVTDLQDVRRRAVLDDLRRAKESIVLGIDLIIQNLDAALAIESAAHLPAIEAESPIAAADVAKILRCTPTKVRELARAGRLPGHAIDGIGERKTWLFYRSEVDAWIRAARTP